jgi:DNA-binding GntR family transcriptional regulator
VAARDEAFHTALVEATGNRVMAQMHRDITERIRIVRRLDFTDPARMDATFDEHGQILRSIGRRKADQACLLLRAHVEASRAAVRRITLHRLYLAREGKEGMTGAAAASAGASGERRGPMPRTGRRVGHAQGAVARL